MEGNRQAPSYSNPIAVAAFWCGLLAVASLVAVMVRSCFPDDVKALDFLLLTPCLGVLLVLYATALAFLGLRHARQYPTAGGFRLAAIGLVLGSLSTIAYLLFMLPILHTAW